MTTTEPTDATHQPLLRVDFIGPSSLRRETHRPSMLPIVGNGPPGTFVLLPGGLRVSLPTDQIVAADDGAGHVTVAFGGMRFVGLEGQQLVFIRVRELQPEERLSPDRSHTMYLEPAWVRSILEHGRPVWPANAHYGTPEPDFAPRKK